MKRHWDDAPIDHGRGFVFFVLALVLAILMLDAYARRTRCRATYLKSNVHQDISGAK